MSNGDTKQLVAEEQDEPAERRPERRDDPDKLLVVMNGALVGVSSAYALSNSLAVTAIAAATAVIVVGAYLVRRER
ncbi:hypothetical protein [Micromonospora echinofusca]|uniref:Uncharacterized protein n=1 Tax=Micromonospora echinofusca TaxID=47858 RepID=A0A1C5GIY6_MICEH|nr:hypothetical protein [Micromonospora echinofusca]SCG19765.1 hypothetical protein GA0070610_6154 [Micromonospora echinofusca]